MKYSKMILIAIGAFMIIATLLPLLNHEGWWVRIFDFPRIQIAAIILTTLFLYILFYKLQNYFDVAFIVVLWGCFIYLCYVVFPYTPLAREQVTRVSEIDEDNNIRILSSNVLMTNRSAQGLIDIIDSLKPDIILLVETDQWWSDKMRFLKDQYPYHVEETLDNTYGMILYSRLRLEEPEVLFLIESDVPSIHTYVKLKSGQRIRLYCLHPKPPTPTQNDQSTERDAELLLVGKMVKARNEPSIVTGDLNDVAWSYTTNLFQKASQMLDPRIGRGFFNTFNAKIPLLRWPLDHVFHTKGFQLNDIKTLPSYGSDHFPIYFALQYVPEKSYQNDQPEKLEKEEKDLVKDKIQDGIEAGMDK